MAKQIVQSARASSQQRATQPRRINYYRWQELGLCIIPFMILLLGMVQLLLAAHADPRSSLTPKSLPTLQSLLPVIGLILALLITHVILSIFFRKADQMLLPLVGLLGGIGVLMATRLGPDVGISSLGTRQLLWMLLGLGICLLTIFALRNIHWLERRKYIILTAGILLVGVTLVNSLHVNLDSPTHDQLNIGPFAFQPSELLKICIVIFFAAYLSENYDATALGSLRIGSLRLPPINRLGPIIAMLFLALLLFLGIRELGLALLIYGIFLTMLYLGTGKILYVITSLGFFAVFGLIGYRLLSYVRARFAVVFVDVVHWSTKSDQLYQAPNGAFQIVQGLIALSSGGILGAGIGLGHPAGTGFVPVVQSDMIFTALGEELGLAILFAIIAIYLLLIYRGFRIAIDAPDRFSQLLAAGLTSIFAIQTIVITAGNMKFIPLTGLPLPFLSYGGSSIIANFIIIGILLRISHNTALKREGLA